MVSLSLAAPYLSHSYSHFLSVAPHPITLTLITWWLLFVTKGHGIVRLEHKIVRSERDVVVLLDWSMRLLDRREIWWSEDEIVFLFVIYVCVCVCVCVCFYVWKICIIKEEPKKKLICVFFFLKVGSNWAMDLDLAHKWLDRARRFRRGRFGVKKKHVY